MERGSQIWFLAKFFFVPCLAIVANSSNINNDRFSLLALKSHMKLDPHHILTKNWVPKKGSICNWIGVSCDDSLHNHNRVIGLNISNMGLVGTIPPEIGNLSFLVTLDMDKNMFYGVIPPPIFNLPFLEVMTFKNNSFSGNLPIHMCKNNSLPKLRELRISFNNLYGEIPSSLGQCSKLESISFYKNQFVGNVPREIGNLTLLTRLYLGHNNLSGMSLYIVIPPIIYFVFSSWFHSI